MRGMTSKIVYLRWLDSALVPEWTRDPGEDTGLAEIETIGYLILEDEQHVQIAQSIFDDYKYSAIQSIPKSVILERQELKVKKSKKVRS